MYNQVLFKTGFDFFFFIFSSVGQILTRIGTGTNYGRKKNLKPKPKTAVESHESKFFTYALKNI